MSLWHISITQVANEIPNDIAQVANEIPNDIALVANEIPNDIQYFTLLHTLQLDSRWTPDQVPESEWTPPGIPGFQPECVWSPDGLHSF